MLLVFFAAAPRGVVPAATQATRPRRHVSKDEQPPLASPCLAQRQPSQQPGPPPQSSSQRRPARPRARSWPTAQQPMLRQHHSQQLSLLLRSPQRLWQPTKAPTPGQQRWHLQLRQPHSSRQMTPRTVTATAPAASKTPAMSILPTWNWRAWMQSSSPPWSDIPTAAARLPPKLQRAWPA